MIIISGNPLEKNKCSDKCQLILAFMEGAEEWLAWAVKNPDFYLSVNTEEDLLIRIQEGLHGSGLICLPDIGLLIHPLRLAQIPYKDLSQILSGSKNTDPQTIQNTLKNNSLYTLIDFQAGAEFLSQLGLTDHLIFKTVNLSEQIMISELSRVDFTAGNGQKATAPDSTGPSKTPDSTASDSTTAVLQKESADFAVSLAQSPSEFVNLYLFYMTSIEKYPESANKAVTRQKQALVAWENLLDYCNGLLETFSIGKSFYTAQLPPDIKTCINNGFDIGFQSKASAMYNIFKFTHYGLNADEDIKALIDGYQSDIKNVIRLGKLDTIRLAQDGLTQSYSYIQTDKKVILNVDTFGIVTVSYGDTGSGINQ